MRSAICFVRRPAIPGARRCRRDCSSSLSASRSASDCCSAVTLCSKSAGRTQVHDEGVDFAVVVVVGEAGAARDRLHVEHRAGVARDIGELAVAQAAKQRLLLRDQVNQAAVENQNVEPAVVVEVVNAAAPTGVLRRGLRDSGAAGRCLRSHSLPVFA